MITGLIFCQQHKMRIFAPAFALCAGPWGNICLHAQNRLNPLLFAFFIEVDHTIHRSMIRNCKRRHAKRLGVRNQLRDACCPVKQAVLRMNMEVYEVLHDGFVSFPLTVLRSMQADVLRQR